MGGSTMRSNASWVMVTWDPPRQIRLKQYLPAKLLAGGSKSHKYNEVYVVIATIGGSRGGREGRTPPPGRPNSFDFMQFSGKFGVFTPPLEGSRPPSGKSWIRHWQRPVFWWKQLALGNYSLIVYVSLRLRVQNAVSAQPCVGKIRISLVLLNFLHCNFRLWFETP